MREHSLKTWPEYFEAVYNGSKTFEVRSNERQFQVGDLLVLREWEPVEQRYTGRIVDRIITYILEGGQWGIDANYCVLGFGKLAL